MDEDTAFVVEFGCGSTVGGRAYQEDRLVATRLHGSADNTFFAVFDGHGGDRCSEFLSKNFYKTLLTHPKFGSLPIVALQETWASFDDKCLKLLKEIENKDPKKIMPSDGSTATVCLINGNDIYLANCGDSAAYVVHQDGRTELLTEDHGTANQEEVNRCLAAGGKLMPQFIHQPCLFPFCFLGRPAPTKPRMMPGGLLVTRSFGDFPSKLEYLGGKQGVVISSHGRLSYINAKKAPPKYLVLASDGVWDVLGIEEVSAMIDAFFAKKNEIAHVNSTSENVGITNDQSPGDTTSHNNRKNSPRKVIPVSNTGSVTDLVDPPGQAMRTASTASMVVSELINAKFADLNDDLNEIATAIVRAAAASPKWKTLGCSADNTSMIILRFAPKPFLDHFSNDPEVN